MMNNQRKKWSFRDVCSELCRLFLYSLHSLDQAVLQIMIPPQYTMFSLHSSFPGSSWIADYDSSTIYHVFFTFFIPWIKQNLFFYDIPCFLYSLHSLDKAEFVAAMKVVFSRKNLSRQGEEKEEFSRSHVIYIYFLLCNFILKI